MMMWHSKVVDLRTFIAVLKMRKHARKGRPLVVNLEKDSIASVNTVLLICWEWRYPSDIGVPFELQYM